MDGCVTMTIYKEQSNSFYFLNFLYPLVFWQFFIRCCDHF